MIRLTRSSVTSFAVLVLCAGAASRPAAQAPADALQPLAPLVGGEWSGRMLSFGDGDPLPPGVPMAAEGFYQIRWERILGGAAVRETKRMEAVGQTQETTYYWDREAGRVAYLGLTSRGVVERGALQGVNGKIVKTGWLAFPDGTRVDYVDTWEITPEGALRQRYVPAEGKGKGHLIELARAPRG